MDTKTKPVITYDTGQLVGNRAVVVMGDVYRLTSKVLRVESNGEFETENTIYRMAASE